VRAVAFAEAELRRLTPTLGEIVSSIDAMQLAIDNATDDVVTVEGIADIHRALMTRYHPAIGGSIRDDQNWIGGNDYSPCGAEFVPPAPQLVAGLLADLVTYCNERDSSALLQAAMVHAQFETIHPFADGNGRTGRALVHVVLRRRGLATRYVPPISVILARRRDRYIRGLTAFRDGDVAAWLEMFALASTEAASLAQHYLEAVEDAQAEWRAAVRSLRRDSAVWELIDVLPAHPVLNVPIVAAATRRSAPQARAAIAALEEAGVLSATGSAKRNRVWEATTLLDLLTAVVDGSLPS
jgi:Fic family protein